MLGRALRLGKFAFFFGFLETGVRGFRASHWNLDAAHATVEEQWHLYLMSNSVYGYVFIEIILGKMDFVRINFKIK